MPATRRTDLAGSPGLCFKPRIQLELFLSVGHLADGQFFGAHACYVRLDDQPVREAQPVLLAELREELVAEESQLTRLDDDGCSELGDARRRRRDNATRRC